MDRLFLNSLMKNVGLETDVLIKDDVLEDQVYFEGKVRQYFKKGILEQHFEIIRVSVDEGKMIVEVEQLRLD